MNQASFLSLAHSKPLRCERFLEEMTRAIPWKSYIDMLWPYYRKRAAVGRDKKDLNLMLKIYYLQQWYNLSDPEAEDSIYDRISFQKFLGIDLLERSVPDETTILNFRHFLEEFGLTKKLFELTGKILMEKGYILKKGTIVDATIISAPSSTKNKAGKRDEEMRSTQKHGQWYFGMKAHAGVDADSGIVHAVETTSASEHDKSRFEDLMHGEERALFGDKGYFDDKLKRRYRKDGIIISLFMLANIYMLRKKLVWAD